MASHYRRWSVVACCFCMALLAWGLGFYGVGVYLVRLRETNGWSASDISTAVTVYNLFMAAVIMLSGDAIGRWGARPVVLGGALSFGIGVGLLPLVTSMWQLYAAFVMMGIGFASTGNSAINTILAQWFETRRGLAISLALNGASVSGIVVTPAMVWLTATFGFSHGLWILILSLWALLLPFAFVALRERPTEPLLAPGRHRPQVAAGEPTASRLSWRQLAGDRRYQTITLAFGFGLSAQVGFLIHQIAYLSTLMSVEAAGWCASMTAFAALAGRLGGGLVVDKLDSRHAAAGNFFIQACAITLLLWSPAEAAIYVGCALFGLTVGNMITLPSLIVQHEFPREQFARTISRVLGVYQVILAFGPGLLGAVHDLAGGYAASLILCLTLDLMALLVILWRSRRPAARAENCDEAA